ncbi:thioredoxin family protein [Salinimicrobium sp. MT39]|uniref:Thioredoxin family protein n=1 Tax=Salinimicrobium profundisediminis TaxID=2994553 RepID=A0A9X3CXX0_9FLAO|nr:thioredoxin family protein [Salinimicrobium profundisediminis]MCX2838783.1 thioredoxin family protein [Salinimicrobium profundisediminis]
MDFKQYQSYFETIKNTPLEQQNAPYDNPDYLNYTKLNWSRMNRWLKTGEITEELRNALQQIYEPQQWIVITEPWCGDAAHITPFLELAGRENPLVSVSYELRDSAPHRIENYRTNGTLSIPKLIIKDEHDEDLNVWGPRPLECVKLFERLKAENAEADKIKEEIQQWYNSNKGLEIQKELAALIREAVSA